jgi:hypothetical protein
MVITQTGITDQKLFYMKDEEFKKKLDNIEKQLIENRKII